jgi:hypothetical protein
MINRAVDTVRNYIMEHLYLTGWFWCSNGANGNFRVWDYNASAVQLTPSMDLIQSIVEDTVWRDHLPSL